ncbi:MAG: DUF2169 domain-containing protein [Sandaracinaceae bacterium]|nr:DUF2169 domain-containing protein [Sandaracinaceae bacterium]
MPPALIRETPFAVGYLGHPLRPPRTALIVVVKATIAIPPGGGLGRVAGAQLDCQGDVHHDDDPSRSVRLSSDFAYFKPRGEVLLAGTCHPPGDDPVPASMVGLRVGAVEKRLAVIGDRRWVRGLTGARPSEPVPFRAMPLSYERSFGGPGHPDNPVGRGLGEHLLPNLEDPSARIVSPSDRPEPAGAFPVARTARRRLARAGTYDDAWRRTRWPWLPEDFDYEHENAAPPDQRITGFWRPDERIELVHLRPGEPHVIVELPGVEPRCLVEHGGGAEELPLRLDTITVDADAGLVLCLWRGVVEVEGQGLSGVRAIVVASGRAGSREALDAAWARHRATSARVHGSAGDQADRAAESPALTPAVRAPATTPSRGASAADAAERGRAEVIARRARGEPLAGLLLAGADLSDLDLRHADLTRTVLRGARLPRARLEDARLDGADLAGASLDGASLERASLREADLAGVSARGACLDGACLEDAVLERGALEGASLRGADLVGADLTEADLRRACLDEARLDDAELSRARLLDARIEAASLVRASLERADASGARLARSDLTELRARGARFVGASLAEVRATRSHFAEAILDQADLSRAELTRANLVDASLLGAVLDRCVLRSARLSRAKLVAAKARRADAMEACLEDADLSHADLRGASLFGAELAGTTLEGADLEGADLGRTKRTEVCA